ncbi:hypothetical protein [Rhizobium sp. RU36D]|uniref:hypothetical protein n=1 Tax=Rhizobium sp. RU36D TaxID=1907415 RepID=UPI0009D8C97C|nr:hypothetical protein [Rhizobium sp. RU36D]SMC43079.1 hypothetical protein SAMN05880593_101276 [Rhizobium sp. RU36D]
MIASAAFLAWLISFVFVAVKIGGLRRLGDTGPAFSLVIGLVGLSAVVALIMAPPDFGGVVLLILGLSFGGSAGGWMARQASAETTNTGFAAARAAGAGGCLWIVAAAFARSNGNMAVAATDHAAFVALLLAAGFSALAFGGFALMAMPRVVTPRLQSFARRSTPRVLLTVGLAIVVMLSAFAASMASLPLLWLSAGIAALCGALYTVSRDDTARLAHNAVMDASAAVAMGMIGIALGEPIAIIAGGFAAAALLGIAHRAHRR